MSSDILVCDIPSVGLSFRMRLLSAENPEVVEKLLAQLPMQSVLGHTVVSGHGIWTPTRIVYTGDGHMVTRGPGAVYLNAPGQSMCITYGGTAESALVNKLGEVFEEDFQVLKVLGKLVYEKTVAQACRELVQMNIRREGDNGEQSLVNGVHLPFSPFTGDWRQAVASIQQETRRVWLTEPEEITKIKYGVIDSGMGTGGQAFPVLVHLEIFLIMDGPHILFRLLMDSEDEEMTLARIIRSTRRYLIKPFDHFEFQADLGLTRMKTFGDMYYESLDSLTNLDEFRELTAALLTLVTRMHRWVHFIFPWNLGSSFPHRKAEEIRALAKIL